jgi:hypothetical protein
MAGASCPYALFCQNCVSVDWQLGTPSRPGVVRGQEEGGLKFEAEFGQIGGPAL